MQPDRITQGELLHLLKMADRPLSTHEILYQCRRELCSDAEHRQKALTRLRATLAYYAAKGCVKLSLDSYGTLRYAFLSFTGSPLTKKVLKKKVPALAAIKGKVS